MPRKISVLRLLGQFGCIELNYTLSVELAPYTGKTYSIGVKRRQELQVNMVLISCNSPENAVTAAFSYDTERMTTTSFMSLPRFIYIILNLSKDECV